VNTGRKKGGKDTIIKRRQDKALGIFVDGVGLDRASRRIRRKVDWKKLLRALSSGKRLISARYYNLLPNSDDNRQISFLDNVSAAGFQAIIKRLPPKHIERQASINVEMAADMIMFGMGKNDFPDLFYHTVRSSGANIAQSNDLAKDSDEDSEKSSRIEELSPEEDSILTKREIVIVCPSKELEYPVSYLNNLGVKTVTADFGKFTVSNTLTASSDWIDLTDSEDIWLFKE
jgi:hypothetical protein